MEINGVMNASMLSLNDSNLVGCDSSAIDCDVVLIGDMFYDKDIAADLHPWMQRLARQGKEVSCNQINLALQINIILN